MEKNLENNMETAILCVYMYRVRTQIPTSTSGLGSGIVSSRHLPSVSHTACCKQFKSRTHFGAILQFWPDSLAGTKETREHE